jgi:hypothetical protein
LICGKAVPVAFSKSGECGVDKKSMTRVCVLAGMVLMLLTGCAGANRGGLKNSREVYRAFEVYHVYPDYTYYYRGVENNTKAIVGLGQEYRIADPDWKEFDPRSKTYEKVVGLVKDFPAATSFPYGAYILDPQGQTIGVWFSSLNAGITVDPETKVVSITTGWDDDDRWGGGGSGVGVGIGTGGSGVGIRLGF